MKAIVSWSGGKDSAMALERVLADPAIDVVGLLTTFNQYHDRVSIHGVRRELLEDQVGAIGLPLISVRLPDACTNQEYERRMGNVLRELKGKGVTHVVYGDLFLADLRAERERKLATIGLHGHFPLWGEDTAKLARSFVNEGYRAVVACVDTMQLAATFSGLRFDHSFLDALPDGVDPCGENGEFHTFVHGGPVLRHEVDIRTGTGVLREGRFQFTDLLPATSTS
jgi:uncharacterized protein (TIGR00290 family)